MSGLFGGSKSPPPEPKKAGDAITVVPGAVSNTEMQRQQTAGAMAETKPKATSMLGSDVSDTVVGDSKAYG